jgi:hypothetical protein
MTDKIIRGRAKCLSCLDVIESKHCHDYVRCKCGKIMLDGGNEYVRYRWPGGNREEYIELLTDYEEIG